MTSKISTEMNLNKKNFEEIKLWLNNFQSVYEFNSSYYTKKEKQETLGYKNNRICRFCGKAKPETTFNNKAHVLPAFMGNTHVKSNYECDECNLKFGKYENDLASFIGLRRFYFSNSSFEKSRKRVFKLKNSNAEIYRSIRGIEVIDPKNEIFEKLEDWKLQRCKINKTPFVPLNVYKSFVKIVLSLISEEALIQFRKICNFLITDELDSDKMTLRYAKLSIHEIKDFHFENPIVFTFSKVKKLNEYEKKNNVLIPDKTFIIYFYQFCIQVYLPFDVKDKDAFNREKILFYLFPPILIEPIDKTIMTIYSNYYHSFRDMSSKVKITNEKDEFFIKDLIDPILKEYTEEEHNEMIRMYDLRKIKKYN